MPETAPQALPRSIDETVSLLNAADYVADRALATVLFLSLKMQRPLGDASVSYFADCGSRPRFRGAAGGRARIER